LKRIDNIGVKPNQLAEITMNFKDQWAEDANGKKFVFTIEMQRALHEAGLPVNAASLKDFRAQRAPQAAPNPNRERRKEEPAPPNDYDLGGVEIQIDPATGKYIGKLIEFIDRKGFGFINHGGERLYFHRKKALDDPRYMSQGQSLLYNVGEYRGKSEAMDVEEYDEPL
jgi:cold shock CspA family protein